MSSAVESMSRHVCYTVESETLAKVMDALHERFVELSNRDDLLTTLARSNGLQEAIVIVSKMQREVANKVIAECKSSIDAKEVLDVTA